jgi:hypothetical protein
MSRNLVPRAQSLGFTAVIAVFPRQFADAPQHGCSACIGGQATVPNEQKTQQ